ncbi:MAG: IS1 family transposase [Planctomycetes bacterium]|nr:IS1 family transposase [Planctomycetota bacterium]
MNKLSVEKRAQIIAALVEGNSIRATCRMTGVAKGTVTRLLASVGEACSEYQYKSLRDLPCERIQCDEIWAFCYAKEKNVPKEHKGQFGYGDVWTWTALCADTKLVPSFLVGSRTLEYAKIFMADLASRLSNRVQLTTDGHRAYLEAVDRAFWGEVDYAVLVKLYGNEMGGEKRYSPAACIGTKMERMDGNPDPKYVSTSYVERQNLTMRMSMRRFTRLTNGFSKKVENLEHAIALHFMHYNFVRTHSSLANPYPRTPAMASGVSDHVWSIEEIVKLANQ